MKLLSLITGVTLKMAIDFRGNIASLAPGGRNIGRFTSPESLDMVHRMRAESDCVVVGCGTVLADDPGLTVRRGYE